MIRRDLPSWKLLPRLRSLIFITAFGLLTSLPARAEIGVPYLPADDDQILQTLPSSSDVRVRAFENLRKQQQAQPDDVTLNVQLAQAYIDYGRATGDARYLGRALAVVDPWLQKTPVPISVLMIEATVLQSRHLFTQSRALLEQILKLDGDNGAAWLTLASVAQVQGDMTYARHACSHLLGSMDALITAACLGDLSAVTGRAKEGYQAIDILLKQEPNEPASIQAWAQGLLADAAKYQGELQLAEQHFQAALQAAPGDNFLLADYADFLLDQNRPREVIALVKDYTQSDTSFLRLALAEAMLGLPQAAQDTAEMAQRFRDLEVRGDDQLYAREQARFVLELQHDAARALKIAQSNWTIQRAPEDVRIYLEAALAAQQPQAAQAVLDFIEQTHLEDPKIRALEAEARKAISANALTPAMAQP